MAEISSGTLYEFNKANMKQIPAYDAISLNRLCGKVAEWQSDNDFKYLMLLSKERSDYTIFNFSREETEIELFKKDLIETLTNRGKVIDITLQKETNAYEIWIKEDDECFIYYLFDYSYGVVEY